MLLKFTRTGPAGSSLSKVVDVSREDLETCDSAREEVAYAILGEVEACGDGEALRIDVDEKSGRAR